MNRSISLSVTRTGGAAAAAAWALPIALIQLPTLAADPCPDVEVVFARGTTEPPGVGGTGQAFVDALRSQSGGRSVGVYAVDYPASRDFDSSTPAGANDAAAHIQSMAANCPNTRLVLGGYSQGAGVIELSTTAMPTQIADHVAAAALFGAPKTAFADRLSPGPLPTIGPLYAAKTIDLCVPNDPICSAGWDMRAHVAYVETGMVNQAASFAATRL
jgi:cutinase